MRLSLSLPCSLVLVVAGCGGPVIEQVEPGVYQSIVPSIEQLDIDQGLGLPGGYRVLRDGGVDELELRVVGDAVTFSLDGEDVAELPITGRLVIRDAEGSGPFRAEKEVLVIGDGPLELDGLTIPDPVIWPGSYEGSPVVTVKPLDPDERGPVASCLPVERCLLLTAEVEPFGSYDDANDPALDQNPVATIEVSDSSVEFVLDTGERIRIGLADHRSTTTACGLSETSMWEVPPGVDPAFNDPVLVHTVCPTTPGAAIQMAIMERADVPRLAPIGPGYDGEWCVASRSCLLFNPA